MRNNMLKKKEILTKVLNEFQDSIRGFLEKEAIYHESSYRTKYRRIYQYCTDFYTNLMLLEDNPLTVKNEKLSDKENELDDKETTDLP